jgi:hypothetical protein
MSLSVSVVTVTVTRTNHQERESAFGLALFLSLFRWSERESSGNFHTDGNGTIIVPSLVPIFGHNDRVKAW